MSARTHEERPPQRQDRGERHDRPERNDQRGGDRPARPAQQQQRPPQQQQQQRDDRSHGGGGGDRPSGPPQRPKRFAEPGAWRRGGQAQQQKQNTPAPAPQAPAPAASSSSKKQRVKPVVTLSGQQKTGKAALNSFGQLFAFIKERTEPEKAADEAAAKANEAKKPADNTDSK